MANENIMDLNEYVIAFNELLEKVAGIFESFFTKTQRKEISDAEFELKYRRLSDEILESTQEITEFLKEYHILEIEYYDFREMESIIKEVLTKKEKFDERNLKIVSKMLKEYKKISALKTKIFHDLIQSGKKSFNEISHEQKDCFEEEYDKFGIALLHLKLEYHSRGEKSGMNIQPLFEEFRDDLKW